MFELSPMKIVLIAIGVVVIGTIIYLPIRKQRKIVKQKKDRAMDLFREQALDRALINEDVSKSSLDVPTVRPVSVSYGLDDKERLLERSRILGEDYPTKVVLEITEISELSQRRYVLEPSPKITIGKKRGKSDIVIPSDTIDDVQCEISRVENEFFIANVGMTQTIYLAGKENKVRIDRSLMPLKSGDVIIMDNILFKVEIITVKA